MGSIRMVSTKVVELNEVSTNESDQPPTFDLDSHEWYLNRELMWLAFNQRVLNEAKDERNPMLERVLFVAVVGSNLDEFFMKRIGGLKPQVGAGVKKLTVDGMLPQEQIDACYKRYQVILTEQRQTEEQLRVLPKRHYRTSGGTRQRSSRCDRVGLARP